MKIRSPWLPTYLALGFVWGCSFIFIDLGLELFTPLGVAFIRCALGALTLLLIAKARKISLPRQRITIFHLWIVALLLNVAPGVFFAFAQTEVTSVLAGIINAVTPLMTLLAILVVNRQENPKLFQVVGLVLGFFGVLVVLGAWRGLGENPFWAVAILFAAVTCYGISYPYIRRFVMPLNLQPESIVAAQLLLGAITLAPLLIFGGVEKYELQLVPILAMLALGIFGSGVAYLWNFKVMQLAGSAIASTVTYLTPLVAIAAGVIFLGEQVTWNEPVGALIVLLGAAIAQERISLRKREANR